MGLLSFLRKDKQESPADSHEFRSRAEEESSVIRARGKRTAAGTQREAADPVLPEKKRARRRLIGAIAIVLAVIVGLPMLLDSEPKPLAGDISIQIPSRDKPFSATVGTSDQPTAGTATPISATPAASNTIAASATLDGSEEIVDARTLTSPATPSKPNAGKPISTVPNPSANPVSANPGQHEPAKPAENKSTKPIEKPAKSDKSEKTDKAASEHKAESKPAVAASDEPEKPTVHNKRSARTEAARDDAARANAILEGRTYEHLPTSGTNSEKPAVERKADNKAENKPSANAPASKFVIQVAALASQEKIDELQGKLRAAGIKSYAQKVATSAGEKTRIRVGPFTDKAEAERMRAKLQALGLGGSLIPLSASH